MHNLELFRKPIAKVFFMFCVLLLCNQETFAKPHIKKNPNLYRYKQAIKVARQRAKMMFRETKIPGVSIAVAQKGEIIWSEGFGKANLEQNSPVNKHTRFRLASVSKIITAAAVARLVDKGLLNLDAPISNYVDNLPTELGNVTVRQLTGHLAGVRHYQPKDFSKTNNIDFKKF